MNRLFATRFPDPRILDFPPFYRKLSTISKISKKSFGIIIIDERNCQANSFEWFSNRKDFVIPLDELHKYLLNEYQSPAIILTKKKGNGHLGLQYLF